MSSPSPQQASRWRRSTVAFLGLALLLAAFVAGLGAVSFQRRIESFRPLGFEARAVQGVWRVEEVAPPRSGVPGHGLAVGDEIFLIRGQTVADADADELADLLRRHPQSELLVQRGGTLESVTYRRPALEVDFSYLILTAIGILYLLVGLYTAFKDRQSPSRLFFLWCLSFAAFFALSPLVPPRDAADRLIYLADQVVRTLVPFLTVHLFLVFPTPLFGRLRRALPLLYLPPALMLGVHFDLFGRATESRLKALAELELYLLILGSLLAALTLALRFARRPGWEQRRQMQLIFFGMIGGSLPFLVLYLLPRSLALPWPSWTAVAAVLPLGLVPLTFAWAIFKYQLLDLAIILRNATSYALTALVGLFGFALFQLALQSGAADRLPVSRALLTFVAGLTIAGALAPTKNAIASGLERLQYRASIGSRQMLSDLGHELLHERDLDRLCASLVEHLADGLVVRATLYLTQGVAMVPIEPRPGLPRTLGFEAFGPDFWDRDVKAVSAIGLPEDEVPAEQRLFAQGFRYAFPLTVRRHKIGVALMSYKYDEEPLNSEDLDVARGLLNQAALALENARLLEEVHEKLEEVTRLEEYSKGILECSPAGIAVIDSAARIVSANHAFAAIAGVARPELAGRPLVEMLLIRPLPEPEDGLIEVSFCEPSGEERYLQLAVAGYRQGQEGDLRIVIVQDASERRAMEAALKERERLASLGMLAAGVAHEVNTPLTGISSYAQLLLADLDRSDPHYEILQKMERQTFRAAQIVNNLLEFAKSRGELTRVDLVPVVGECVQLLEERAGAAAVEVRWQPPAGGPAMHVAGHEGELHQIFNNLIVNAIDAVGGTPEGRVEVTLEIVPADSRTADPQAADSRIADSRTAGARPVDAAAGRIRARVSDNGPGIPPERLESIFRPFFSSKLSDGGTGLGLAITYNLVRRHGGDIRVENQPGGKGCTFTVDLPRFDPPVE